jgi:hypothetical protein
MSKIIEGTMAMNVPPITVHFGRDRRLGIYCAMVPPTSPATPIEEFGWFSSLNAVPLTRALRTDREDSGGGENGGMTEDDLIIVCKTESCKVEAY